VPWLISTETLIMAATWDY